MSVLIDSGRRGCEPGETRKSAAKQWEIDDGLWAGIEPLLPGPCLRYPWHPGRKRLDSRKVLCGILFVLCTGIRLGVPATGTRVISNLRPRSSHAAVSSSASTMTWCLLPALPRSTGVASWRSHWRYR